MAYKLRRIHVPTCDLLNNYTCKAIMKIVVLDGNYFIMYGITVMGFDRTRFVSLDTSMQYAYAKWYRDG